MGSHSARYPFVDLALARRLERAEGRANASCIEARMRLWPERQAARMELRGAYALFDGPHSPLTQTFGLGIFEEPQPADLDAIEEFFAARGAQTFHEVSPLATSRLFALLGERGYQPFEFTSVMFRPVADRSLAESPPAVPSLTVRVVQRDEEERWTRTAVAGWSEFKEVEEFMADIGRLSMARPDTTCFLAEAGGEPVATGVLSLHDGVALFAGASTVPRHRGKGAQFALLAARLRFAAENGCDLAMMCAAPGSASQRNAERHGFRIAYTRMKFRR